MSESKNVKDRKKNAPENVPLGTGLAASARKILIEKRKKDREMAKRFNINN